MKEIEIIKPDDWHVHLRDGDQLEDTVRDISRYMGRAIVMPNLTPPILNGNQAKNYKKRIQNAIPAKDTFNPLMTLYLTENTRQNELKKSYERELIFAASLTFSFFFSYKLFLIALIFKDKLSFILYVKNNSFISFFMFLLYLS